jgi:hypothetical protein
MNTDPIGNQGQKCDRPNDDLNAIFQGGDRFMDRMRAFGNARHASEAAFQRLQLGNDAKRLTRTPSGIATRRW